MPWVWWSRLVGFLMLRWLAIDAFELYGCEHPQRRVTTLGEVFDCWFVQETVRDIYLTGDVAEAEQALKAAIDWCTTPESCRELRRLAKTLRRWRQQIVAHHSTGASNGPVEAANLMIKTGEACRTRVRHVPTENLLAAGITRDTAPVTRLRARPSSVA